MSKHLRRAVQGASRGITPPPSPAPQPPPPTEQPPPPPSEPETREEKVKRLLEIARRPSLSNSLKLSRLERGSSANEVSSIDSPGDSLKRSSSYREQKSPRMTSAEPELAPAKKMASSGTLPSSRRLSVDLTGLLTDRRHSKESPPVSPRKEKRNSVTLPASVLTGTYSRILYYSSPMGAFMTPPTVFLVPNDTMSDEVRTALARAHFAEFGAGTDGEEEAMKVEAIYICDNRSQLHKRFDRKKWPAEHYYLQSCLQSGAPDPQLSGEGTKRVVTHEYIFKHPV